jgi:hypothetical protein
MNGLPKVLLVDDEEDFHELFGATMEGEVEFIDAYSIGEAEILFEQSAGIAAIVVDACVPGSFPTTEPLIRKIKAKFSGPIIGISSEATYRERLLAAGCEYQCAKTSLEEVLRTVLAVSEFDR